MKICVYGAGAIGGYLAVGLVEAGFDVCVVARGEHLAAIQHHGLCLIKDGGERRVPLKATANPSDLGPQDLVICALKAHQAWENAEAFLPLLGPVTPIVTAMNGLPWWYFHKTGGPFEGRSLRSVDRDARQWRSLGPERAIGCVVEPACEVIAPGIIEHRAYNRFQVGEPDGSASERVTALASALTRAGFAAPIRRDIRNHVWLKLFGNACFNPISVLTHATIDRIATDPALRALCKSIIIEARTVALSLGIDVPEAMIERRLNAAAAMAGHKMSMLQDLERCRELELDAVVEAVVEAARLTDVPTPYLDMVLALARERERHVRSAA